MHQNIEPDFGAACKRKFLLYCGLYAAAAYHSEKRYYVGKAYDVVDAYLTWAEIQAL